MPLPNSSAVPRTHAVLGQPIRFFRAPFRLALGLGAGLQLMGTVGLRADLEQYRTNVLAEPSLVSLYTFEAANAADVVGTNHGTLAGTTAFADTVIANMEAVAVAK